MAERHTRRSYSNRADYPAILNAAWDRLKKEARPDGRVIYGDKVLHRVLLEALREEFGEGLCTGYKELLKSLKHTLRAEAKAYNKRLHSNT